MSTQNLFRSSNLEDPYFNIYCNDLFCNNLFSTSGTFNLSGQDLHVNNLYAANTVSSSGNLLTYELTATGNITSLATFNGDIINANSINANAITSSGNIDTSTLHVNDVFEKTIGHDVIFHDNLQLLNSQGASLTGDNGTVSVGGNLSVTAELDANSAALATYLHVNTLAPQSGSLVTLQQNLTVLGNETIDGTLTVNNINPQSGNNVTVGGNLQVDGSATIQGTLTSVNKINLDINDPFIYLNVGNRNSSSGVPSGIVLNTFATSSSYLLQTGSNIVPGVAGISQPTCTLSTGSFSSGQYIQISGSQNNDGIYEVNTCVGTTLTIRGVGTVPVTEVFTQNQFISEVANASTYITWIYPTVLKCNNNATLPSYQIACSGTAPMSVWSNIAWDGQSPSFNIMSSSTVNTNTLNNNGSSPLTVATDVNIQTNKMLKADSIESRNNLLFGGQYEFVNTSLTTGTNNCGIIFPLNVISSTTIDPGAVFVPGVNGVSNPTVTIHANTFAFGQFVMIYGSQHNDGLYEVFSNTGTTLVLRGIGLNPTTRPWSKTNLISETATGTITITHLVIEVIRADTDGASCWFYTTYLSDTNSPESYNKIAIQGDNVTFGTIAGTWAGNTIASNKGGTGNTSYTDGQLLIGDSTTGNLDKGTINAGTGISITNGHGSITIATSGSATYPISWIASETQVSGTNAQNCLVGWNNRILNTLVGNASTNCTLATNHLTLVAGTYMIEVEAQVYNSVGTHKLRFYNITDNTTDIVGNNAQNGTSTMNTSAVLKGKITITATKVYLLDHYTASAVTWGLGGPAVGLAGISEVYCVVKITQVA